MDAQEKATSPRQRTEDGLREHVQADLLDPCDCEDAKHAAATRTGQPGDDDCVWKVSPIIKSFYPSPLWLIWAVAGGGEKAPWALFN